MKRKARWEKKAAQAQAKAPRRKNEGGRELDELKQQIHNATEMVFELSQALGLRTAAVSRTRMR